MVFGKFSRSAKFTGNTRRKQQLFGPDMASFDDTEDNEENALDVSMEIYLEGENKFLPSTSHLKMDKTGKDLKSFLDFNFSFDNYMFDKKKCW